VHWIAVLPLLLVYFVAALLLLFAIFVLGGHLSLRRRREGFVHVAEVAHRLSKPGAWDADWVAKSEHYRICSFFEDTYLIRRDGLAVNVGDFYGHVVAAAFDPKERWCVMVGAGLIAYRLSEPFNAYGYPSTGRRRHRGELPDEVNQWWEWDRYPPEVKWLSSVVHVDGDRFRVIQDREGYPEIVDIAPRAYILHADERRVEKVPGWFDVE
jgi:hypothetical protein